MMEKELAQATKLAEQANKKVAQLRKKLLSETEKAYARAKRDLSAARKKHGTANARLKKARASLGSKASKASQMKVEGLRKQVAELADAVAGIAKTTYTSAEKYMPLKADAVLEERKAKAAERAAAMVEIAAARQSKSN